MKNQNNRNSVEWDRYSQGRRMLGISYWTSLDIIPSIDEQQTIINEIVEILKKHNVRHYCIVDDELLSDNIKTRLLEMNKECEIS